MDISRTWTFFFLLVGLEVLVLAFLVAGNTGVNLSPTYVEGPPEKYQQVDDTYMDLDYYFEPESPPGGKRVVNRSGFPYAVYRYNEEGLREDENFSKEKPDDVIRIGFFGDSFIWGQYVNNSQLWTERLERRLNRLDCEKEVQVINFGVNAYDAPYSVEFYRQVGQEYDLDYKFFVMKDDEIMEAMEILKVTLNETMSKYRKKHDLKKNPSPYHTEEIYYEALDEAMNKYRAKIDNYDKEELLQQQVYTPFNSLDEAVEDDSSVVIFTSLISEKHNKVFREQADKHGFRFISMNRMGDDYGYDGLWGQFSFPEQNDVHPNEKGHRFISDFLYTYVVSNNLVKCDTYDAFQKSSDESPLG